MAIRVLFDATSLCSATLSPGGIDMKLLLMARGFRENSRIEAVITQQIVAEWERNCRMGFARRNGPPLVVSEAAIDRFVELLEPLLSREAIATVRIGRFESPLYPVRRYSRLNLIQLPVKGVKPQKSQMLDQTTFGLTDIFDFHVVDAAIAHDCDFICTYNQHDLPDGLVIGDRLEIIRPERLHRRLSHI